MKKILLFGLSAFIGLSAVAQENNASVLFKKNAPKMKHYEPTEANPVMKGKRSLPKHDKKTRAAARWYSYLLAVDTANGGNGVTVDNTRGQLIWQDSTVLQTYTSGPGTINYSSSYSVLDPTAPLFNDPATYGGEMFIGSGNAYSVDSVTVYGSYIRPIPGGPTDTLILSLVKQTASTTTNDIGAWNVSKTAYPEMLSYGYVSGIGADTLMSINDCDADSVRRIAENSNPAYIFKMPLTNADTSSFITPFTFAIPTALACEANKLVGASVTFKSGGTWVANVDNISNLNHYLGVFSEEALGKAQEYRGNAPDFDLNTSGSMFSTNPTYYAPSFMIEMWNTIAVGTELLWIDYHILCPTCKTVGVTDIKSNISVKVSPNPATTEVNFSLNLKESANNVSIDITNTLGQIVKTISIGAITANTNSKSTISVSDLAPGLYIYTIKSDGQKMSDKLMIK